MRTTVTLDPDVAIKVKNLAYMRKISFKVALNETLRRGLSSQVHLNDGQEPFAVHPHESRFKPGIDLGKLGQIADDLEVGEVHRGAHRE
ncbi:MAG: hypothetical protein QNJ97_27760 [Myxococcota bacterium]|nr:hypothetical protein [Myxococcota bacterium]